MLEWMKHEAHEIFTTTVFFFLCFLGMGVLKKLYLADVGLDFPAGTKALVGALVVAKVVIVLSKTNFGNRFAHRAVWLAVLYKSLVFTFCSFLVVVAEKLAHGWYEEGTFVAGFHHAVEHIDYAHALAQAVPLFFVFGVYHLLEELDEWLGPGVLRSFVLRGRGAAPHLTEGTKSP